MSHTPGPWHWNGVATIWNTLGEPGEVDREVIVAQVVTDWGDGRHVEPIPVRESNARLIAASPDLLAVCEELVRALSLGTGREVSVVTRNEMYPVRDMAMAAISKAKGE